MSNSLYNLRIMAQITQDNNTQFTNTQPNLSRTTSLPSDHVGVLIASVIMMIIGWGGMYQLITSSLPRIGGELWMFFMLLQITVTGTVIPFIRYVNVRFTPHDIEVPPGGVIVRQSTWVGLYAVMCAWLQIPRVLNVPVAALIALIFIILEVFLRSRELVDDV